MRAAPTATSLARLAVFLLAVATPPYALAGDLVHVVAKGQNLGRIAKRYGTTVDALREANGLARGERLHPGLELVIPDKEKPAKKAAALSKVDASTRRRGAPKDEGARRPAHPGFVRIVRGSDHAEIQLLARRDHLVPAALPALNRMLRFDPTATTTAAGAPTGGHVPPIDPRLATLIGIVSDHFGGRTLHVISGYRPYMPTQYTQHSNHNAGKAVDFTIDGVPNTALRDFCRGFRNAGVGYYPNSTFVHLDVRGMKAYWIDYSRPGERPRYDSQSSQSAADESASEVETGTAGSSSTQEPTMERPETMVTNPEMPDSLPAPGHKPGATAPTVSPRSLPAPDAP